jgi:hypothetical protein
MTRFCGRTPLAKVAQFYIPVFRLIISKSKDFQIKKSMNAPQTLRGLAIQEFNQVLNQTQEKNYNS